MLKTLYGQGVHKLERSSKSGIGFPWYDIDDFGIHIGFLVSARSTASVESSETPGPGLFDLCVGEKNGMRSVRSGASFVLRPEDPKGPGFVLRGCAHLPGGGDPKGLLPKVQERETREIGMAGGQSFPHEAICLLCGPSVSGLGDHGCREGTASGLEDGEGPGKAIHAGAVEASGTAWAEGDWD